MSSGHSRQKTFRNLVDHCKPPSTQPFACYGEIQGTQSGSRHFTLLICLSSQHCANPPQRALNRRCSVQSGCTNSTKVPAGPQNTHAELFAHPQTSPYFADVSTGWLSGDPADGILINIPWNKSVGCLGCKALKFQLRYSFVLQLPFPHSIDWVTAAKKFRFCTRSSGR